MNIIKWCLSVLNCVKKRVHTNQWRLNIKEFLKLSTGEQINIGNIVGKKYL